MARAFARAFYKSKEWQAVRNTAMMRDRYLCQRCGKPAEEVHHIVHLTPQNIGNIEVTMNLDNLVCLCRDCHFEVHKEERMRRSLALYRRKQRARLTDKDGIYMDMNDGMLKKRRVILVYGAPYSGKTTFVREHKEEHDIVIDLDAIISAFQMDDKRYIDNNIMCLALDVREFLYDKLAKRDSKFDCHNVWVVGGFPKRKERKELANMIGADEIYIECTIEECLRRAKEADKYNNTTYSQDIVNAYFGNLEKG